MAITGTDRGTGTHNTSALSFTLSPGSNFSSGTSWGVLVIAVDNSDSSGTAHSTFTVTDSLGNTWSRDVFALYDPGAASAGVEGAVFTTEQNGGTLTTGTTITVTFDANCTAKAWALHEVTPGAGNRIVFGLSGTNSGAATGTPTVTTSSITNGGMVIGAGFAENTNSWAGDADTTNGTWSTQQATGVGSTTSAISVTTQRKVVSATATQTYNPTRTSSDCILAWISLYEEAIPAAQFDASVTASVTHNSPSLTTSITPAASVTGSVTTSADLLTLTGIAASVSASVTASAPLTTPAGFMASIRAGAPGWLEDHTGAPILDEGGNRIADMGAGTAITGGLTTAITPAASVSTAVTVSAALTTGITPAASVGAFVNAAAFLAPGDGIPVGVFAALAGSLSAVVTLADATLGDAAAPTVEASVSVAVTVSAGLDTAITPAASVTAAVTAAADLTTAVSLSTVLPDWTDDFNRADGALGANWVSQLSAISIVGNQFNGGSGDSFSTVATSAQTFSPDQEATITVGAKSTDYLGLCVRGSTGNGYFWMSDGNAGTSSRGFWKYVSGTWTELASGGEFTYVVGDTLTLRVVGTMLSVFKNGQHMGSITDTSLSSGQPGVHYWRNGTGLSRGDNFVARDLRNTVNVIARNSALTTAIRPAASVNVAATSSAALTTAIELAATPSASVALTGTLSDAVSGTMEASVSAAVTATAVLNTTILMAAAVSGAVTSAAALSTSIRPAASVSAAVTTSAGLTTAIRPAASVAVSVASSAALTAGAGLVAALSAAVTPTAALSTSIRPAASVAVGVTTTAALTTAIAPAAAVSAAASGAASLTTAITPAASVTGTITAAADLTANPAVYTTIEASVYVYAVSGAALQQSDGIDVGVFAALAGSLSASAATAAALTTAITPAASVTAAVTAAPSLTTQILMAGSAAVSGAASGSLAAPTGFAAAVSTAVAVTGALTTAITPAASVTAGVTAAPALATVISPAAAVSAAVTTNAALSTAIRPAAAISASVAATGGLTTATTLAADVTATVTAAADMEGTGAVASNTATVTATGDLTTAITMAATRTARVTVRASLDTDMLMAVAVTAGVTVSADLTANIRFVGALAATVNATAGLTTALPLVGSLSVTGTSAAALTTRITPAAAVSVSAAATASLQIERRLNAAVTASVSAAAWLGNVNGIDTNVRPDDDDLFRVPFARRFSLVRDPATIPLPVDDVPLAARVTARVTARTVQTLGGAGTLGWVYDPESCDCANTAAVPLFAAVVGESYAVGALDTGVALAASPVALVTGTAALTAGLGVQAAVGVSAALNGALTDAATFGAVATATVIVPPNGAQLTAFTGVAGAVSVGVATSAALTVPINLGAAVAAAGTVTGTLSDAITEPSASNVYYSAMMRHSTSPTIVGTLPNLSAHSVRLATVYGTPTYDTTDDGFGAARKFTSGNQCILFSGIPLESGYIFGNSQARSYDIFFRATSISGSANNVIWAIRDTDFGFNSPGQIAMMLMIGTDSKLGFYVSQSDQLIGSSGGTYYNIADPNTVTTNTRYHVRVSVYTDGTVKMFRDHVEVASGTMPSAPSGGPGTRTSVILGGLNNLSTNPFAGQLEGFSILNIAPTSFSTPTNLWDEGFKEKWDTFSNATISNSDRTITQVSNVSEVRGIGRGRIPREGKWYCEMNLSDSVSMLAAAGIVTASNFFAAARSNATTAFVSSGVTAATQASFAAGRIMLAFDWPNKQMWVGRNGTWFASGDPAAGTNPYFSTMPAEDWYLFTHHDNDGSGTGISTLHCASGNLSYSPPSGFSLLV